MIELRWLTRDSTLDISEDHIPCYTKERVLQYRQKIDTAVYAGIGPFPDSAKNMQWSQWKDVPEVTDGQ